MGLSSITASEDLERGHESDALTAGFKCYFAVFCGFRTTLEEERTQEKAVGEIFWGSM